MNVVYSFIGPLPDYAVDTVRQLRMFYDGPVYFIVSDLESNFCSILRNTYNVEIVPYNTVINQDFIDFVNHYIYKFNPIPWLSGREKLFLYSFERFFILKTFMEKRNIQHVFYPELDNLIYDDPNKWFSMFSRKEMAFMYDNKDRCSSGISYIKSHISLNPFLEKCKEYIISGTGFISEMFALHVLATECPEHVQLLPIHWPTDQYISETYSNYECYNDTIFDAASIGIFLGGLDPCHTDGKIVYGYRFPFSLIDYTNYKFEWVEDDQHRKIPYIWNGNKWLKINNLHVHSKHLKPCMSKD